MIAWLMVVTSCLAPGLCWSDTAVVWVPTVERCRFIAEIHAGRRPVPVHAVYCERL